MNEEQLFQKIKCGLAAGLVALYGSMLANDTYVDSVVSSTGNYYYRRHACGLFYNPKASAILRGVDPLSERCTGIPEQYAPPGYSFASPEAQALAERVSPQDFFNDEHHKHYVMDKNRDQRITEEEVLSYVRNH